MSNVPGCPRVLVADDDDKVRWLMKLNLTRAGYEVLLARDGKEAYDLAEHEHPDVAILDVMMPEMDGVTLCHELKAHLPATKVMMLTVKGTEDDMQRARDAGADLYMLKPYSLAELLKAIQTLTEQPSSTSSYC